MTGSKTKKKSLGMPSLKAFLSLRDEWSPKNETVFEDVNLGSCSKYWWVCGKKHEWEATLYSRSRLGSGCPLCSGNRVSEANSLKIKAPHLEKEWHSRNQVEFACVSFGSRKRYWWVCDKAHEWEAPVFSRATQNQGCPFCAGKKVCAANSLALNYPELARQWSAKNQADVGNVTWGSGKDYWWVCEKGHEWEATPVNRARKGSGCPFCSGHAVSDSNSMKEKAPFLEREWSAKNSLKFEEVSYGSVRKVWWVCEKGHEWEATPNDRTRSDKPTSCVICSTVHTRPERAVEELFGVDRFNKGCGVISSGGRSYRPDLKLSDTVYLNVDGLYWHSEQEKGRYYHYQMREAFEAKGLRLLQFWEDEVNYKPQIVKSMVDAVLGRSSVKLHGRKCKIVEPPKLQADEFLEKNHIIGPVNFSHCLGLEFDGDLVQILCYRLMPDSLEITRTATKLQVLVRGGLSKLVAHVKMSEDPAKIITFCDLRYADGHSLEKLGFVRVGKPRLDYMYASSVCDRKHKFLFRVKAGVNEVKAAADRGYWRIYDAGKVKYVWTRP